jgi:hypothetical protein
MALLKELFAKIKEADISFSRGEVDADPDAVGDPDAEMGAEMGAGDDALGGDVAPEDLDGMGEDEEDVIGFDVPTFIRVLEWAREEAADDEAVHEMTEKLLALDTDFITMEDFEEVVGDSEGSDDEFGDEMPPEGGDEAMGGPEGDMGGEEPPMNPEDDAVAGM